MLPIATSEKILTSLQAGVVLHHPVVWCYTIGRHDDLHKRTRQQGHMMTYTGDIVTLTGGHHDIP